MKLNKKRSVLYIDTDEKYHFIVGEMLKDDVNVCFSNCESTSVSILKDNKDNIDTIILCIDNIDHFEVLNQIDLTSLNYLHLILISQDIDAMKMYDLVAMYGADDYLTKPFSRQGIVELIHKMHQSGVRPFKKRLYQDIVQFNNQIDQLNHELKPSVFLNKLKFDSLDNQINQLMSLKNQLEPFVSFPKSIRPNILFIDDEKNIIDVYQNFVEDKPFNSFFSKSLAESRQVLMAETIQIIILDLGLPDGHGVNLLKEIYEHDCTDPELPDVIVISSYFEKDTVIDVINAGAKTFINKPMTYKKFISVIYQLTFLRYMRSELDIKKLDLKKKYVM